MFNYAIYYTGPNDIVIIANFSVRPNSTKMFALIDAPEKFALILELSTLK